MSLKSDTAVSHVSGGFGCAASVLQVFCEDYDLDTETAARLSCGLGGGCASGEICGAVSGAVLVVGLKFGQETAGDNAAKANCRAHVIEFIEEFKKINNALTCRDLLDCDPTTEEGRAVYLAKRETVCFGVVKNAVEILEKLDY